jgi:uncharacterized protein YndB with AHSA1/START domain
MMETCDLTIARTIDATPEEIYDIWLDPKSPGGPWFGSNRVIMNPVVDGLFNHSVEHEGKTWAHYGRFNTLDRGKRIEHTWMSEATRGFETIVTVTFAPHDGKTDVILKHAGVPDDAMGRQHEEGWTWMLSMLVDRFAVKQ